LVVMARASPPAVGTASHALYCKVVIDLDITEGVGILRQGPDPQVRAQQQQCEQSVLNERFCSHVNVPF